MALISLLDEEERNIAFKRGIEFELGATLNFEFISVEYKPNDGQGRYSFKSDSKLYQYLKKSKGWVVDSEEKYTLNYIIIVYLAQLKKENRLFFRDKVCFLESDVLRETLGCDWFYMNLMELKPYIINTQLKDHRILYDMFYPPFTYVPGIGEIVASIFEQPVFMISKFITHFEDDSDD